MNNQAYDDTATRNPRKAYTDYENSTYTVVSKVAYLIGVQKRIFENEYEPPKMEWYDQALAALLRLSRMRQKKRTWRPVQLQTNYSAANQNNPLG